VNAKTKLRLIKYNWDTVRTFTYLGDPVNFILAKITLKFWELIYKIFQTNSHLLR